MFPHYLKLLKNHLNPMYPKSHPLPMFLLFPQNHLNPK
jgi:hypothetical protein